MGGASIKMASIKMASIKMASIKMALLHAHVACNNVDPWMATFRVLGPP